MLIELGVFVLSYFFGTFATAYIVPKVFYHADIRKIGSGNVGGANVLRAFGWKPTVLVALGDVFKGSLAVFLARYVASLPQYDSTMPIIGNPVIFELLAGFFAALGHSYNVFLKFSGGKAGATSAGALLVVSPLGFLFLLAIWVFIVATSRYTSFGNLVLSLLALYVIPITTGSESAWGGVLPYTFLIWWRHRENIRRLIKGEERKLGEKVPVEEIENAKI